MISAIILAGGSSRRMGEDVDKLMIHVAQIPLLAHVLLAFENCSDVQEIVLVARQDRQPIYQDLAQKHRINKLTSIVAGGIERQDSVWCGLNSVSQKCEIVLVHDAARALVTPQVISQCIAAARQTGAAIPAARIKDTIKRSISSSHSSQNSSLHLVEGTVDRSLLWAAQTPQTFRIQLLRQAYEPLIQNRIVVTDDASAVERMGYPVSMVESDPLNLKVTTPEDLLFAEAILARKR